MPAASWCHASSLHPNSWRRGAIVSDVSVDRPVMTTCAPFRSASTIGPEPEVRIRAHDAVPDVGERRAGIHVAHLVPLRKQLIDAREEVVTADDPELERPGMAARGGDREDRVGARRRIHATRVRDHLDAPGDDRGKDGFHGTDKVSRVAHGRITLFLLLQDGHRDFGEVVEHQVVDRAAFDLPSWSVEPVAPESLAGGDANDAISCVKQWTRDLRRSGGTVRRSAPR